MSIKACRGCGEAKDLSESYQPPQMSDGRLKYCKDCKRAEMKENRSRKRVIRGVRARAQPDREATGTSLCQPEALAGENPQKMAVQLARCRAHKLNAEGDFTVEDFEILCEKYGNVCLRCGDRDALLTPDHVVPLSIGDSNLITNVRLLCGSCNSCKNIKVIDYRTDTVLSVLT